MRAMTYIAWALAAAVLLALPFFVRNHVMMIVALIGVTAIITSGLTILTGMTGLISLAQAAFCACRSCAVSPATLVKLMMAPRFIW